MLRALVALLLLANLGFFAWSRGWLEPVVGLAPQTDRDPARLKRQVHPEVVQVLPAADTAASGPVAMAAPAACLEAGPFAEADVNGAEQALQAAGMASTRWQTVTVDRAGVWAVYMGKFADADTLKRKETELQRLRVGFEEARPGALEPGLVLGRFPDKAGADEALARLTGRGVRTARVIELAPPSQALLLRLDTLTAPEAQAVRGLRNPAGAALFRPCAPA